MSTVSTAAGVVSAAHRFLHGRTPRSPEKQIWVLSGQVQDWFYHNLLFGCMGLRQSLERWALDGGMALTVALDRNGTLDLSGNPDSAAAQQRFDSVRTRRPSRYGSRRQTVAPPAGSEPAEEAEDDGDDAAVSRRTQTARAAGEAAGGTGQAILNTAGRITHLLQSTAVPSLVIVEEFPELLRRLGANQATASVADDLVTVVRDDWHGRISHAHRLVFISMHPSGMKAVLPPTHFRKVEWRDLEGPRVPEIRAAISRFARRRSLPVRGIDTIAQVLESRGNLQMALTQVVRVAAAGEPEVTLERVLQRPALNEAEVRRVMEEMDALTGLDDVRDKLLRLESNARGLRRRLLAGNADVSDASLHMVFTGAPGTGKTTVARLVARLYHALGLLPRDEVREVVASTLMSSNVGETRENMQRALEEARGGVLFIDEAHQFGDRDSTQAREAVQALVPMAWNHRQEMVIILAGYADQMHDFWAMDPGLDRRFPMHGRIEFRDYSPAELWTILERMLAERRMTLDPQAAGRLRGVLERRAARGAFGNAGGVKNLLAEVIERHGASESADTPVIGLEHLPPLVSRDERARAAAMRTLDGMVGLAPVRERIDALVTRLVYDLEEEEHGQGTGRIHLHPGNMLFTGPPGTGKTTVGQVMAQLLFGIGVISRGTGMVASRADLVAGYTGQTALKVRAAVERARDGVLMIDEAYALVQGDGDEFGREALDELVRQVTAPENTGTVFILAGYRDDIHRLLARNAGLQRRFPVEIEFPGFTPEDCAEYARRILAREGLAWEPGVPARVADLAHEARAALGERFGNAGWVDPLVSAAADGMRRRVTAAGLRPGHPARRTVAEDDFPAPRRAPVPPPWEPRPDAAELAGEAPAWRTLSREELVDEVLAGTAQVLARAGGETRSATAFFVTADGVAATSAHVVAGAGEVTVFCGAARVPRPARVLHQDDDLDIALLSVADAGGVDCLPMGESRGVRSPAELVVAGNAHVRPGESARAVLARVVRNDRRDPRAFETDGAIEPGFSGGPVVDPVRAAVVGMVMGGYGPSATVIVRAEQLREALRGLGYRFS